MGPVVDQKHIQMITSQEYLNLLKCYFTEFIQRFIIVDEIRIHYDTPETKQQSKQSVEAGKGAPKKPKTLPSTEMLWL